MYFRQGAAYVLRLIRDNEANTWEQLCIHFNMDPNKRHATPFNRLRVTLQSLAKAGLIQARSVNSADWSAIVTCESNEEKYRDTGLSYELQNCLDISISELAKHEPGSSMLVEPSFGIPWKTDYAFDLFVMMPFLPEMKPIYDDHIMSVAQELKISVARADNFSGSRSVIEEVWNGIANSKVLLADCTGKNPNVFYELGIAHTIGKPVFLMTQTRGDIPFDISHLRYLEYQYTPRGMREFEAQLKDFLQQYFV